MADQISSGTRIARSHSAYVNRSFSRGLAALDAGDITAAIRHFDSVSRNAAAQPLVAFLCGRLLQASGRHAEALPYLDKASAIHPGPEASAAIIKALWQSGRTDEAVEALQNALRQFAAHLMGPLAAVSTLLLASQALPSPGWVGISPRLSLIGAVAGSEQKTLLLLSSAEPSFRFEAPLIPSDSGVTTFRIERRQLPPSGAISAMVDDQPLLGSPLPYPPAFLLDGRATFEGNAINGWASLGWQPGRQITLRLGDEKGAKHRVVARRRTTAQRPGRFHVDLRAAGLTGNRFDISVRLPDGRYEPFPASPFLTEPLPLLRKGVGPQAAVRSNEGGLARRVDIVIPVYRGRADTLACIASVLETIPRKASVVVVDDASPEAELSEALDELARSGAITLLRNDANLGFPASANIGMALHPDRDIVLLNADTLVFGDWLGRLRTAAYSRSDIGSVTPLTNTGAIASYSNPLSDQMSTEAASGLDQLAARTNGGAIVDIPVGVGFCLFLKRDCLDDVGDFDAGTFGRGYGEENDLCMRARACGWRHILAGNVFVWHRGGRSFGSLGSALMDRNRRLLNLRHRGYDTLIEEFIKSDPLQPVRRRLDEARLLAAQRGSVLVFTHRRSGGVDRFVRERCDRISTDGLQALVLRPLAEAPTGIEISTIDRRYSDLRYPSVPELQTLVDRLDLAGLEVHHLLGISPDIIDFALSLDIAKRFYVHDYVWICPRIGLVDGTGRYCGEPEAVETCDRCIERNGSEFPEVRSVATYRQRHARWLAAADEIVVPSQDVARRLWRYFPDLSIRVEPWEAPMHPATAPRPTGAPIRVAVIGALGEHKGYRVVLECARDAAERNLPLEFVIIGYSENDDALSSTGKVFVVGRYEEAELPGLILREDPHVALFASVTPETWCYSLTPAVEAGLLIVAFDHGAIAERLRAAGIGTLLPIGADAATINESLLTVAAPPTDEKMRNAIMPDAESLDHKDVESRAKDEALTVSPGPVGSDLTASVEQLTLPTGLYLFSVRAAAPRRVPDLGNLLLPAVQVGPGPGTAIEAIDFMTGPRSQGSWLCEQGNTIIAKIIASSATLLLTSVRVPGEEALAIDVRRLDGVDGDMPASLPLRSQAISADAVGLSSKLVAAAPEHIDEVTALPPSSVRLQTNVHVRNRGDLAFVDAPWAGRVAPDLWIEGFALTPLEGLSANDIEYKGLTATGIETPWITNAALCGTRGMGIPLVGFAIRVKSGAGAPQYDCDYRGYFQSGATAGPCRNGVPCLSTKANDPLEGMEIRITRRPAVATDAPAPAPHTPETQPKHTPPRRIGPRFGKFREDLEVTADEPERPTTSPKPAKQPSRARTSTPRGKARTKVANRETVQKKKAVRSAQKRGRATIPASRKSRKPVAPKKATSPARSTGRTGRKRPAPLRPLRKTS